MVNLGDPTKTPASIMYKGCKVAVSWSKQGFRVFLDMSQKNPSDRLVRWSMHATRKDAWEAALDLIEKEGKA